MRASVLAVCLLVVLAGCGSGTSTTTNAPVSESPAIAQSTSEAPGTTTSPEEEQRERAAEAKHQREEKAEEAKREREQKAEEARQQAKEEAETPKPTPEQRYPEEDEHNFLVSCKVEGGTPAGCQCELDRVEAAHSLEEVAVLEDDIRAGVPYPEWMRVDGEECKKTYG